MPEPSEARAHPAKRPEPFSDLMGYRVAEILLVASDYDAFILEEDGQLTELMFQALHQAEGSLGEAPRFTSARSGREALALLAQRSFDLLVTTARLPDLSIQELGLQAKATCPGLPVGVLATHNWETPLLDGLRASGAVDWVFLWLGDVKALFAMIRQHEDQRNAEHDVLTGGVQVIIVVEDEIRFSSFFLPHIYAEVTHQTSRLMAEGLNLSHRLLRLRARPKILLAQTFEEAWALVERYGDNLLGILSDVSFPLGGRLEPEAGLQLAGRIRQRDPDLPVLLMSTDPSHGPRAEQAGAVFLAKEAPGFLEAVRAFMGENFGFGDFIFRLPDRTPVGRASNLRHLLAQVELVPDASLAYHSAHNHFSKWYAARTEFALAATVKPMSLAQFPTVGDLRAELRQRLQAYLRERQRRVITDFQPETYDEYVAFAKIGKGSLGGKGRGLAFLQKILAREPFDLPGVELALPRTLVLASDLFEAFLEKNGLQDLVHTCASLGDQEVLDAFRRGRFDRALRAQLARFLEVVRKPLAVRSSSILEDSPYQPFAGVYATIMLPNNHPSLDVRLAQLLEAIKRVYASTYMKGARDYLETTPHHMEEERMAIVIQRLVGTARGSLFFPTLSGVTCSYNFYPFGAMTPAEGTAQVALGLGKAVVEGFEALRFCPAQPEVLPQFSLVKDILRNAQRRFWALDLAQEDVIPGLAADQNLRETDVTEALRLPGFGPIASTYLPDNDRMVDGLRTPGTPLVTFSRLLKGQEVPLPAILTRLLQVTERTMGVPVELEFAVDLNSGPGPQTFHVLQIRPMNIEPMARTAALDEAQLGRAVVVSPCTLGHGRSQPIHDLLVVSWRLDRARTRAAAQALEALNRDLRQAGRSCILIGPGRWGSADPWLGIPVTWPQISTARAIIETDFQDLELEASQGSHFFHNLSAFGVAYGTVHRRTETGRIDWDWLEAQPSFQEALDGMIRHLRLEPPLNIVVDGARGLGAIL